MLALTFDLIYLSSAYVLPFIDPYWFFVIKVYLLLPI